VKLKTLRKKKAEGAEWRDCDISDLCQLQRGFDITEATRKAGNVPVYSSSGLSYFHNEARLKPPAVITGRKGILGKVFLVKEPCWPHDTTLWVRDFKGNDPEYVYRFLSHFKLERFDAATSVPTLNRNNLVNIPICLPPPAEQRAIAGVLGDVDALIGALDRLIAKKRDLKQAAMQQLLTGQTRLPGFSGKWEVKSLRDLCRAITDGTHFTPAYVANGVPFYSVENVTANDFKNTKFISVADHRKLIVRCKPERGDILLTRIGSIGDTRLIDWDLDASIYVSLALLKLKPGINAKYLYAYTKSRQFVRDLEDRSLLNAAPKKTNMGEIGGVPIPVPCPEEQTAIAAVLSDMDAEIAALEKRRHKTRLLKQGMMQKLLTGRIRLS
jgi:type I restriction enzyme S subunit